MGYKQYLQQLSYFQIKLSILLLTSPIHKHVTLVIMSGNSNVGQASVYEAKDQRTVSNKEIEEEKKEARFHEGQDNAHKANDPLDQRSLANRAEREEKREQEPEPESAETKALK